MTRLEALRNLCTWNRGPAQVDGMGMPILTPTTVKPYSDEVVAHTFDDLFADSLAALFHAQHGLDALNRQVQAERHRIAGILATFAAAPISMATIQPVLDLAAEMNMEAK